jgi:hypothetical protein
MSSGRVTPVVEGKTSAMSAAKSEEKAGSQTPALEKSSPAKDVR